MLIQPLKKSSAIFVSFLALILTATVANSLFAQVDIDGVKGDLIQFTDNGAWSWYQDERAVVDKANHQIIVGAIANRGGYGGSNVDGDVRAIQYDFRTGSRKSTVLANLKSYGAGDDHNVPAYKIKQDGNVLAFYAGHNNLNGSEDGRSFYRTLDTSTQTWGSQSEFNWWNAIPDNAPGAGGTTYSNVFQLANEDIDGDGNGRIYNIARTQQSPHIMYSDNNGTDWVYGGQLTKQASNPPSSSYVNGYYKFSSNGVDRIDIIATEFHPRDYNTSIYHAYIKNGQLFNSADQQIDDNIFDVANTFDANKITSTDDFTLVFEAGTTENSRAWNSDVQVYADGSMSALFKARDGGFGSHESGADNHNTWLARFDPNTGAWTNHEIARAGGQLFSGNETDYTGIGALDPNDPNTVYISTEINPITNVETSRHEIYKGVTADNGSTFSWSAVTENSSYDNLRPIVADWDSENTALMWWRGTMSRSQNYDAAVVGIVFSNLEEKSPIEYVDASASNTQRVDGFSLNPTTGTGRGAADGNWHVRQGFGNASSVYASAEIGPEDVPTLVTTVSGLDEGLYDVFAFFWSDDDEDWQLLAGLDQDDLMAFRRRGSQGIDSELFDDSFLTSDNNGDLKLYRAYLGRSDVGADGLLQAFIDGSSFGPTGRTWYDGIGYSRITAVPEPGSVVFLLLTTSIVGLRRRRR